MSDNWLKRGWRRLRPNSHRKWFRINLPGGDTLSGLQNVDGIEFTFESGWDKYKAQVSRKNVDKLITWLIQVYPRGNLANVQTEQVTNIRRLHSELPISDTPSDAETGPGSDRE